MKVLITICRIIVGSLFIVSGLIKVNDVIGFGYKLEEYFAETALNFPAMVEYVIPIAMFIVIGEVLLGVALLLGTWPKLTTGLILFMTVFFLWLTNYTASCIDRREAFKPTTEIAEFTDTCVETCGCFGDAIPLKPRESFYKDVILLFFVIPVTIAAWRKKFMLNTWKEDIVIIGSSLVIIALFTILQLEWIFPITFTIIACGLALVVKKYLGEKVWLMALVVTVVCSYVQYHTYTHLPLKDYRGYAIGNNIGEKIKSADEKLNETAFAHFVEDKVMPLLGDTIDFTVSVTAPDAVSQLEKYISETRSMVPALAALSGDIAANKATWSSEIAQYQPPKYVSMYSMKNASTGEMKEIDSDSYLAQRLWEDKSWEIDKDKTYKKQLSEGYEPKIKDFNPTNLDGEEVRSQLLNEPRVFWLISKMPDEMDTQYIAQIVEFSKAAQADGAKFFAITPASGEDAKQLQFKYQMPFDFLTNDNTELKIIIRSNPGIVYLENGVVVNMWADNDLPDYNEAKAAGFKP